MDVNLLSEGLTVAIKGLLILGPVLFAFWRKDKDAMERLLSAIPDIFDAVQQERRRLGKPALDNPLKRALGLASDVVGRDLSSQEAARVTTALNAHHERLRDAGQRVTPLATSFPGLAHVPSSPVRAPIVRAP